MNGKEANQLRANLDIKKILIEVSLLGSHADVLVVQVCASPFGEMLGRKVPEGEHGSEDGCFHSFWSKFLNHDHKGQEREGMRDRVHYQIAETLNHKV